MTAFPPSEPASGSKRLSPARRVVYGVMTVVLVSIVTIVIGELGVRIVAPQPASWLDVYRRHPALPFYALAPHVERLIDTGETRWTVFTDEHGYRVSERDAKAPRPADTASIGSAKIRFNWEELSFSALAMWTTSSTSARPLATTPRLSRYWRPYPGRQKTHR